MHKTSPSPKKKGSYRHILKYTGLFGIVQVLKMLMDIIRNKLAAEFLGPSGLGLLGIYSKAIGMVSDSSSFGISISSVKQISERHESSISLHLRSYIMSVRLYSLLSGLFGSMVFLSLSPMLNSWADSSDVSTFNYAILSPVILMLSVTGGEMSILKGTKQLSRITKVSVYIALSMLLVFSPLFFFMKKDGVVLALLLSNLCIMIVHLSYSTRDFPYRISFRRSVLTTGSPLLKAGIWLMVAGLFGKGSEYLVYTLILNHGGESAVGLYNSGYIMAISYASIIFSALDADYYPRLSSSSDVTYQNTTVNNQIEVCLLLVTPFLIFFAIVMPIIIPLLYSGKFVDAIPMSIGGLLFMYFRSLGLPVGYLSLARGDTKMYMLTELIYDILIAVCVPYSFVHWGLIGCGFTLSFCGMLDFMIIYCLYSPRYHFRFAWRKSGIYLLQFILLSVSIYIGLTLDGYLRWIVGGVCCIISLSLSYYILSRATDFTIMLKSKLRRFHE